jgi:putative ABC transport system permease protein
MSWLSRVANVFRSSRLDQALDEELSFHIETRIEELVSSGVPRGEAEALARRQLGNPLRVRESSRDVKLMSPLDELGRDVRYALRQVRRNPVFSAIVVATLALGIGANSAIFSVVYAVLIRPLPYHDPDRLVSVGRMLAGEYLFLRDATKTLGGRMAFYRPNVGFNLSEVGGAERVTGAVVSANLFSTLGVGVMTGRAFTAADEQPGERAVLLSHALWRERFGADASIVGREILVDGESRMVVGVMPPAFAFPSARTQIWIPYTFDHSNAVALWGGGEQRGDVVARLTPRVVVPQARAELRALAPALRQANTVWLFPPEWGRDREVELLQDGLVGDVRLRLLVLLGAVGIVLLIACANVANLQLARGTARQREFAIRSALGAARGRIARQLLTESAIVGLLGGILGLLVAYLSVPLLVSVMPVAIPRADEIRIDRSILGFTLGLGLLTGLVFGAVPALRSSWRGVPRSIRVDDRASSASLGPVGSVLVVGEIAVAVLLVIGAGLLIRSFAQLLRVDPGFRSDRIVTARITLPAIRYAERGRAVMFYDELLARVGALPGVEAAEATSHLPLRGGGSGFAFEVEGKPYVRGTVAPTTAEHSVTPGYLEAMAIPVLRGRSLAQTDRGESLRVAVINEAMARQHWPGQDPLGKRLKPVYNDEWITVVGVARDVKYERLTSETAPTIYRPFVQTPTLDASLVVRTASDPAALVASLRAAVAAVDRTVPVSETLTLEQVVAGSVAASRFTTLLLAAFAAVALLLAAIGTYGVLSYVVSRRAREMAVRMALGAQRADVVRMVLGHAAWLAGAGTVGGVAAALATTHVLEGLLFGVTRTTR